MEITDKGDKVNYWTKKNKTENKWQWYKNNE